MLASAPEIYSFAAEMASGRESHFASTDAMALESVQPVPCVSVLLMRLPVFLLYLLLFYI